MRRADRGWVAVVLACTLVELWLSWAGPVVRQRAIAALAFWPQLLNGSQIWGQTDGQTGAQPLFGWQPLTMFVSYGVLHTGWSHLAGNMLALGLFGWALAGRIGGAWWFVYFYTLFLLAGGLGFALLSARDQPMIGASGAIMGLYGLWLVWDWRVTRRTARVILGLAAAIAADQAIGFLSGVQLAWETHLGGLLGGAVAGAVLPAFENREQTRSQNGN